MKKIVPILHYLYAQEKHFSSNIPSLFPETDRKLAHPFRSQQMHQQPVSAAQIEEPLLRFRSQALALLFPQHLFVRSNSFSANKSDSPNELHCKTGTDQEVGGNGDVFKHELLRISRHWPILTRQHFGYHSQKIATAIVLTFRRK